MSQEIGFDLEEDEYIEESRCVRCEQEISWDEDINNLGMCTHAIENQDYERNMF